MVPRIDQTLGTSEKMLSEEKQNFPAGMCWFGHLFPRLPELQRRHRLHMSCFHMFPKSGPFQKRLTHQQGAGCQPDQEQEPTLNRRRQRLREVHCRSFTCRAYYHSRTLGWPKGAIRFIELSVIPVKLFENVCHSSGRWWYKPKDGLNSQISRAAHLREAPRRIRKVRVFHGKPLRYACNHYITNHQYESSFYTFSRL
jgi:hypothetical protein